MQYILIPILKVHSKTNILTYCLNIYQLQLNSYNPTTTKDVPGGINMDM